jgi:hypothetical protein
MPDTVVFTPEAETQLTELYGYIAGEASPDIAARFTDGIVTYCESLSTLPLLVSSAMTSGPAFALPTIEGASSWPSRWMPTALTASESSTAARITRRHCSTMKWSNFGVW